MPGTSADRRSAAASPERTPLGPPSEATRARAEPRLGMTNLGSVLLAATLARWFATGFDPFVLAWLVVAIMLIWSGVHVLTVLEANDAAG